MKKAKQEMRAMWWLALIFMLAAIGGCGDKITNYYTTVNEGMTSIVRAKLIGWRCGVGDFHNNPEGPGRFTSSDPLRALVTFEYINGNGHSEYTNDSSEVTLELPNGPYRIIVETKYTWPDTFFNCQIPDDLNFELNITYDFWLADSIRIGFWYSPASDSLGIYAERRLISRLRDMVPYMFGSGFRWASYTTDPIGDQSTMNDYYLAIRRGSGLYTYEVIQAVKAALSTGRTDGIFPASMSYRDAGYICLM